MNPSSKLFRPAAALLAAGGACWVTKFVVIAATDGAVSGFPDTLTGILYLSAVSLMVIGLATLFVALTQRLHPVLRALAGLVGVVAWGVTYVVLEMVAQGVVGDSGPSWLPEEIGIVVTGAAFLTLGLLLGRRGGVRERELVLEP